MPCWLVRSFVRKKGFSLSSKNTHAPAPEEFQRKIEKENQLLLAVIFPRRVNLFFFSLSRLSLSLLLLLLLLFLHALRRRRRLFLSSSSHPNERTNERTKASVRLIITTTTITSTTNTFRSVLPRRRRRGEEFSFDEPKLDQSSLLARST